jgi:hypothetical protein
MLGFDRRTRAREAQRVQLRTIMLYASNSTIDKKIYKKKRKRKEKSPSSRKIPSACGYLSIWSLTVYQFSRAFAALAGIFNPKLQ